MKLLLMDSGGTIVNSVSKEYPLYFPHSGWSEQNPEDWYEQPIAGIIVRSAGGIGGTGGRPFRNRGWHKDFMVTGILSSRRHRQKCRTIGIGRQNFEAVIKSNIFYIDKTAFIKEWWENEDEVTLLTRPRRFGKTLTMSMVEKFFSVEYADREDLFQELSIWQEKHLQLFRQRKDAGGHSQIRPGAD